MVCGEDITYHGMLAKSGSRACHRTWTKHWVISRLQHLHPAILATALVSRFSCTSENLQYCRHACAIYVDTQDTPVGLSLHKQLLIYQPAGCKVPGFWTALQAEQKSVSGCPGVSPSGPPLLSASRTFRGARSLHSPGPHQCATPAQVVLWLCKWISRVPAHTSRPHSRLSSAMRCGHVCVLHGLRTCGMP